MRRRSAGTIGYAYVHDADGFFFYQSHPDMTGSARYNIAESTETSRH